MNCLVDNPVEITYSPQDVIEVILSSDSNIVQKYFSTFDRINTLTSIGRPRASSDAKINILDFKPLWAIRRNIVNQALRIASVHNRYKQGGAMPKSRKTNPFNEDEESDEGNIMEEEDEKAASMMIEQRQNQFSQINCKPSITNQDKMVYKDG
jgi:hypothetical protein